MTITKLAPKIAGGTYAPAASNEDAFEGSKQALEFLEKEDRIIELQTKIFGRNL